jgi:hypothetical protein
MDSKSERQKKFERARFRMDVALARKVLDDVEHAYAFGKPAPRELVERLESLASALADQLKGGTT